LLDSRTLKKVAARRGINPPYFGGAKKKGAFLGQQALSSAFLGEGEERAEC
jgi:hypothetical protein